jgi:hypothetical protein
MPKILIFFSMFKDVKLICKLTDELHTDHSFQQALCNRVDRVRVLHHDTDFSVAYGGRSDSRRRINCAKAKTACQHRRLN